MSCDIPTYHPACCENVCVACVLRVHIEYVSRGTESVPMGRADGRPMQIVFSFEIFFCLWVNFI